MLDTLTRVNDVQLLWGVCRGPPSGAWTVVRQICRSHHIELRAKEAFVPVRDKNVVNAVVEGLMGGNNERYWKMICHFMDGV
ncbi:hypothetical protein BC826DRAFT_1062755 [Russula brevipes]|nr:hypothetical protein BC826DRAFT_1062755 [Russula brevipes]